MHIMMCKMKIYFCFSLIVNRLKAILVGFFRIHPYGDMLFFQTGDAVIHVGVVIDDMRSEYWRRAYLGMGRPGER